MDAHIQVAAQTQGLCAAVRMNDGHVRDIRNMDRNIVLGLVQ